LAQLGRKGFKEYKGRKVIPALLEQLVLQVLLEMSEQLA
jgi:hypothetical protein